MTSTRPHQTLRALLFTFSAIAGIAALVLMFAPNWPLAFAPGSVPPPANALEFAILRAFGVAILVIAYLLCAAARDPIRYAAIIDGFIFLLVAFAILNISWVASQQLAAYYPNVYLIVRAAVQITLAIILFMLRPKNVPTSA